MKLNINGKEIALNVEDIQKAIEDKNESFEIKTDGLILRTTEEDATFKENVQKEAQGIGIEIGRKNIMSGIGIEPNGAHKDDDKAIEAVKTFMTAQVSTELENAKIEPDKKVQELQKDKDTLVLNMTTLQNSFDTFKSDAVLKDQDQKRLNTLSSLIPDNTLNTKEHTLTIMNATLKTGFNDVGVMHGVGDDGQPIKNPTTMELKPMKEVVQDFFDKNTNLLTTSSGGAGGVDSADKGNKQNVDDFIKEMGDKGIAPNSIEFNTEMSTRQKADLLDV